MARCLTRWFLPENVSKLRRCRTRDRKNRSGGMNREVVTGCFMLSRVRNSDLLVLLVEVD